VRPAARSLAPARLATKPAPAVSGEQIAEDDSRALLGHARIGCSARDELTLLSGVQAALRERRGKQALVLLEQHAETCPSARFHEEHSAARILALCLLHRQEQASAEAAQFLAEAPRSPLLARLRSSCAAPALKQGPRRDGEP
jgi:hypothetical protein